MNKRVNYMELLKESVGDRGHDTTKSVDVKGPFLDPILGYDGGGELPTFKDAASILERYYFNQDADAGVTVSDAIQKEGESPEQDPASEFHEPAGRGDKQGKSDTVEKGKTEVKKDVKQESEVIEEDDVENAVIERLIAEMEQEDEILEEEDFTNEPVAKTGAHDPAGKPSSGGGKPDKDLAGLIDGDDKSGGEGAVKPATFPAGSDGVGKGIKAAVKEDIDLDDFDLLEAEDFIPGGKEAPEKEETPAEEKKEEKDEKKEDELDVDTKTDIKKESGAPVGNPHTADTDLENLDEAFEIFKEAMEDDDVPEFDADDNTDMKV